MTICLQILYTSEWNDIANIVVPNAVNYCRRHGYLWNIQQIKYPYDAFEKIKHIQTIFENDEADVVWSLDCDTLITNHNFKAENLLDNEHDFYICKDYYGINAGSFIIKNTEWSKQFLHKAYNYKARPNMYCEQNAIERYIGVYGEEKIKLLPHPSINSYLYELYPEKLKISRKQGQWEVGDWILHLPAMGMQQRLEVLKDVKERIIYE